MSHWCRFALLLSITCLSMLSAATTVPESKHVVVLRGVFPDDPVARPSLAEVQAACDRVAEFYQENSYNNLHVTFTIMEPLMLPHGTQYYRDYGRIAGLTGTNLGIPPFMADLQAKAIEAGIDINDSNYLVCQSCADLGFASRSDIYLNGPDGFGSLSHEFGHAIGFGHDFAWDAEEGGIIGAMQWRDNYSYGLSEVQNYEDFFSTMGGGSYDHFSLPQKLPWLNDQFWNVTTSGTYRIYAYDQGYLVPGARHGLTIRKNALQHYWAGYRANRTTASYKDNIWMPNGLCVWMQGWDTQLDNSGGAPFSPVQVQLDMTPHSSPDDRTDRTDTPLTLGRTYADSQSNIYMTPVAVLATTPPSMDVVVQLGTFPNNAPPSASLSTSVVPSASNQILVEVGKAVTFTVAASDPDGDPLAYYWVFGDNTNATQNAASISHTWTAPGLYTLRVEVSDMKGGKASVSLAVNVGLSEFAALDAQGSDRKVFWGRGQILDQEGNPVQDARVWVRDSNPLVQTYTDSDGRYILANVNTGTEDGVLLSVFKEGWNFLGLRNANPFPSSAIPFNHGDLNSIDFLAYFGQRIMPEVLDLSGNPVPRLEDGRWTLDEDAGHAIIRLHRRGPTPEIIRTNPEKPIADILSKQLLVRLYPNSFASSAKTLNRRVTIWDDSDWSSPTNPNNPINQSVEFALGGNGHTNRRIPSTYNPNNPTQWGNTTAANAAAGVELTKRTADYSLLRWLNHSTQRNPLNNANLVAYSDPTNPNNRITSISVDNDSNQMQIGPHEHYVWFHTQEDAAYFNSNTKVIAYPDGAPPTGFGNRLHADYVDIVVDIPSTPTPQPDYELSFVIPYGQSYWVEQDEVRMLIKDNDGYTPRPQVSIGALGTYTEAQSIPAALTITRSGDLTPALTVGIAVTEGTAKKKNGNDGDFADIPNQVVIPAGESRLIVPFTILDDNLLEGTESFTVSLEDSPSSAYEISGGTATVNITDNERPQVTIMRSADGLEGGQDATFRVQRAGNIDQHLRVKLAFVAPGEADAPTSRPGLGVASPGDDYKVPETTLDFPAGVASVEVKVVANTDSLTEGDEAICVRIEPGVAYEAALPARATAVLHDRELPIISLSLPNGGNGNEGDTRVVRFTRTGPTASAVSVAFNIDGSADYATDYRFDSVNVLPGRAIFAAGQASVDVNIAFLDDSLQEGAEQIKVALLPDPSPAQTEGINTYNLDPAESGRTVTLTIGASDGSGTLEATFLTKETVVLESQAVNKTVEVEISAYPDTRWDYNASSPAPYANLLLVDYEIVADTRSSVISAGTAATAGVDFETRDSADIGTDFEVGGADAGEPIPKAGGTIYFKLNPDGTGKTNTRVSSRFTGTVTFTVLDDSTIEPSETFLIRLKKARLYGDLEAPPLVIPVVQVAGELGPAVHVVRILDDDAGTVALALNKTTLSEAVVDDAVELTVSRAGDVTQAITTELQVGGSAVATSDYQHPVDVATGLPLPWFARADGNDALRYRVDFAAGETTHVYRFTVTDDDRPESAEQFWINILRPLGGLESVVSPLRVSITDDDSYTLPQVWLTVNQPGDALAFEGSQTPAVLLVKRASTNGPLAVTLQASSQSTASAVDLQQGLGPYNVNFLAGQDTATVNLTPIDDGLVEGTEQVYVSLVSGDNYELREPSSVRVRIIDDDGALPLLSLEVRETSITEDDPSHAATLRIHRQGMDDAPMTIGLIWSGTASAGTDFRLIDPEGTVIANPQTLEIPSGVGEWLLLIEPINDALVEGAESIAVQFASSSTYDTEATRRSAALTLLDDELSTVSITADTSMVAENAGTPLTWQITREGGSLAAPMNVALTFSGTASSGSDYPTPSATVTIPAGQSSALLSITPTNDTTAEADETIVVTVQSNAAYAVSALATAASATILDNDRARVWIETLVDAAFENDPVQGHVDGRFRVHRSVTAGALNVRVGVSGTARPGSDFTDERVSGENYRLASFADGQATVDVVVAVVDDDAIEDLETVILTILSDGLGSYNLGSAELGQMLIAQCTIESEDVTSITVEALSAYAKYQLTPYPVFRFTRVGSTFGPLRVNFTTSGTAVFGVDYADTGLSIDFADGEAYVDLPLTVTKENTNRRSVIVSVADPARPGTYAPKSPSTASMVILSVDDLAVMVDPIDTRAIESTANTASVRFKSRGPNASTAMIPVQLGGTASALDYTATPELPTTWSITSGNMPSQSYVLTAVKDGITEGEETLTVKLADDSTVPPTWYVVGKPAEVVIRDVPELAVLVEVVNNAGDRRATTSWLPAINPDNGLREDLLNGWKFPNLNLGEPYVIDLDTSAIGRLLWQYQPANVER